LDLGYPPPLGEIGKGMCTRLGAASEGVGRHHLAVFKGADRLNRPALRRAIEEQARIDRRRNPDDLRVNSRTVVERNLNLVSPAHAHIALDAMG
jgi:hypothetical protein